MKKIFKRNKSETPSRITNDTVEEHRKRVLSSGKKFKYPLQYVKHKLVINTIIISILAFVTIVVFGWWQLYQQQNTSELAYRTTLVLPLPVAMVDGQFVEYSDYLMRYKSSVHYLETKEQVSISSEDGIRQSDYLKRLSMREAISDAYAAKLANEYDISVSKEELNESIDEKIKTAGLSEAAYNAIIKDYYNWDVSEYQHILKAKLLHQKVAYHMDDAAKQTAEKLHASLASAESLYSLVEANSATMKTIAYGSAGWVPRSNQDGGLAQAAAALEQGGVSGVITSTTGSGYYIVRLIDSNDSQVNYEYIQVKLTKFDDALTALYEENKVNVFIAVSPQEEE